MGKALADPGLSLPSREIGARNADRLAFLNAAAAATDGAFVPVAGRVLVMQNGRAIGAVGIGGDSSDKDEAAAGAPIMAAGLTPQAD
jgi:uncharacterized protein GlcG (DUF336 family)